MERFFILKNSTNTLEKKFRVIHGGYSPITLKKATERTTIDGEWDISQGGLYNRHEYVLKIRDVEEDADYGDVSDMREFFSYNNPSPSPGNPSNQLHFTDHFGNEWIVMLSGDFMPMPLSVVMEGEYAQYNIKISLIFLEQATPS